MAINGQKKINTVTQFDDIQTAMFVFEIAALNRFGLAATFRFSLTESRHNNTSI